MLYSRKPTRLPNYNYSSDNFYFITICTHEKACIFGTTEKLNTFGEIANNDMKKIGDHYNGVHIDNFVIMPNHIHAIVVIKNGVGLEKKAALDKIIGQYKSGVSRKIRKAVPDMKIWQRSFHDHIIRNQVSYEKI